MSATVAKPARRRTWKQDPEGRRAQILEAAQREFAKKGVQQSRVDEIARIAGVAEGTIYNLFGTKRGLLEAVGAQYGEGLAQAAFADLAGEISPAQLEAIVRNIFRYVRETEGAFSAFLLANDPAEGGPAEDANRAQMLRAIEAYLEQWERRGMGPINRRVMAQFHFNVVEGALRDCFLRGNRAEEEAYIGLAVRMMVGSMIGQPGADDAVHSGP